MKRRPVVPASSHNPVSVVELLTHVRTHQACLFLDNDVIVRLLQFIQLLHPPDVHQAISLSLPPSFPSLPVALRPLLSPHALHLHLVRLIPLLSRRLKEHGLSLLVLHVRRRYGRKAIAQLALDGHGLARERAQRCVRRRQGVVQHRGNAPREDRREHEVDRVECQHVV